MTLDRIILADGWFSGYRMGWLRVQVIFLVWSSWFVERKDLKPKMEQIKQLELVRKKLMFESSLKPYQDPFSSQLQAVSHFKSVLVLTLLLYLWLRAIQ